MTTCTRTWFRGALALAALVTLAKPAAANLDAVFSTQFAPDRVCLGDGAGSFTCADLSTDVTNAGGVALGHVNGDTELDAVFGTFQQPDRVCLGNAGGGFSCSDVSTDAITSNGVALGDVNGDTNLDAVFARGEVTRPIRNRVCLGDGAGGFACSSA